MPKKRNGGSLPLLPVMHIYCEGEKTEPHYIKSYIATQFPGDRRRDVIKVEKTKKNTPVQLVDVAAAHKRSKDCPDHDEFWVVYDREAVGKYPDTLHQQALNKAEANGINVAISNVCFEVWLYLHFQPNTSPYSCFEDFLARSKFKGYLATLGVDNYEKGNGSLFAKLSKKHITDARKNAEKMNRSTIASAAKGAKHPYELNPYTDMHLLLDSIDSFK